MLQVGIDCHVHTLLSGHAYCTVRDNIMEAAERKLPGLGIADHFGGNFFALDLAHETDKEKIFATLAHFLNPLALPKVWHGVRLYSSVEIDIVDTDGNLFGHDIPIEAGWGYHGGNLRDSVLCHADYAIASVHHLAGAKDITPVQGTAMYSNALRNPAVRILGHIGRAGIPFEVDEVLRVAKETGKIIEINEHSFDFSGKIKDDCRQIALRCAELGVWIAVNSDAHCSADVGIFNKAIALLEEIHFPQELIANATIQQFEQVIGLEK